MTLLTRDNSRLWVTSTGFFLEVSRAQNSMYNACAQQKSREPTQNIFCPDLALSGNRCGCCMYK